MEILYILGSTRSGTSALRNAIVCSRFKGYGEGHLVPLLQDWIASVETARARYPEAAKAGGNAVGKLREHRLIRHLFDGYERYWAAEVGATALVDKTPTVTPILLAPKLNLFHRAPKFIHCGRRHIDNIASKLRKFPAASFESHCEEWAGCRRAWVEAREKLDGNFLDLDFHDLVHDGAGVVERMGDYLELSRGERDLVRDYLAHQRPEATGPRGVDQPLTLAETGWSDDQKECFLRICGPLGESLGYGLEEYFVSA